MALSKQISRPIPYSDTHWKVPVWHGMGSRNIPTLLECAARSTSDLHVECIVNSSLTKTEVSVKLSVEMIHQLNFTDIGILLRKNGVTKIKFFVFSDKTEAEKFADEIGQLQLMETLRGTF